MFNTAHSDWSQNMGTGATVGAGQYPAKYTFSSTAATCNDFIAFNTSLAGSSSQASVIAYSNLYTGCSGTVPSTYWAYNTGGTISTSVALSLDGTQLAFVQAQGGAATLVLLKWKSSTTQTAGAPQTLTATSLSGYRNCTAPCMTTLTLAAGSGETGTITDSYSSPYYDYDTDTLYVGDDPGYLHQFTNVFLGTPAESTGVWPVHAAAAKLSSPVYDSTTGNVFVTTAFQVSNNSGGRMQTICATSTCVGINNGNATVAIGTATPSGILGPAGTGTTTCGGGGTSGNTSDLRLDSPIVDSTAGMLYVFLGNDGNGSSAVIQFPTLTSTSSYHSCGSEATVGTGSTSGVPTFLGTFDNLYFSSSSGSKPTGNLYVCGNTGGNATLYRVGISSNTMAASGTSVLAVSTANTTCSPVTESYNGTTDRVFLSVQARGSTSTSVKCPSNAGCLMSFSVPTTSGGALPTSTSATIAASGGSSGIVIDNTVTPGTLQTSQVYYSTLTGGTAVQASQSALH